MRFAIPRALILASSLAAMAPAASAATYIVPSDEVLVQKADAIVRGTVMGSHPFRNGDRGIETDYTISVDRVLKGGALPDTIVVRQPGGLVDGVRDVYPGIGELRQGERVLLMLSERSDGVLGLTDFALGKFQVAAGPGGAEILRRDGLRGAFVLDSPSRRSAASSSALDPDRDGAGFELFITGVVRGGRPRIDYVLDPAAESSLEREAGFTWLGETAACSGGTRHGFPCRIAGDCPNGTCPAFNDFPPARRSEFDQGTTVTYTDEASGDAGGNCGDGCHDEVATGVAKWGAVPETKILLAYGGTAVFPSKCKGELINQIQFNDPCNEITNLSGPTGCNGTLAVGGFQNNQTSGGNPPCPSRGGLPPTQKILRGFILVNNGAGSCLSPCAYTDMIAHETGHTIGAGHSESATALMAPFIRSGQCGALASDDVDYAECFYPQLELTCNLTATKTSGEHPLIVTFGATPAGGEPPYTFDYDFGDGAGDTSAAPVHTFTTPALRTVQVTVEDSGTMTCTDTIDVNVLPCTAPVVTSATAKVTATGVVKALVVGTGFKKKPVIQIDSGSGFVSAPITAKISGKKLTGKDVVALWPIGPQVMVRVLSNTGCPSNAVPATR